MFLKRLLKLKPFLGKKSCFLFGPRSVGKTLLIHEEIKGTSNILYIDLLKARYFTLLSGHPSELENLIEGHHKIVIIDEIQKAPLLLDEVHRLIEERKINFLLTGSSARKLKRGHANLLGGRAWTLNLFPLVSHEIPHFDLHRALRFGSLPSVWLSENPEEDLDSYISTYLKEEILAEGLSRNLPAFNRFLKVAALSSGNLINYAEMASDAQVAESTLRGHFEVLQDTLIGYSLEPFIESKKRKAITTPKFYLFDNGVRHALMGTTSLDRNSDIYGSSFEAFLAHEIRAYLSYTRLKLPLTFWRSTSQFEVDFLIGKEVAIEVKSTSRAHEKHLKGLMALSEEKIFKHFYLVTQDPVRRSYSLKNGRKAILLPWNDFLKQLWNKKII